MKPRLTVVERVCFQGADGRDCPIESSYSVPVDSDEQLWARTRTVGPDWEPLQCGWIGRPSGMFFRNDGDPAPRLVQPTPEERAEAASHVLELGLCVGDDVHVYDTVPPGESRRMRPPTPDLVRVRCRRGSAKYTVHLTP